MVFFFSIQCENLPDPVDYSFLTQKPCRKPVFSDKSRDKTHLRQAANSAIYHRNGCGHENRPFHKEVTYIVIHYLAGMR